MSHAHHGHQHHSALKQRFAAIFFLIFGFAEIVIGGVVSSALLVDGAHNVVDGAGFFAQSKGTEFSQLEGYSRKRCVWAPRIPRWVARVTWIIAGFTGVLAIPHLWNPEYINPWLLLTLGGISWAANYSFGKWLHSHGSHAHEDEGNTVAGVLHLFSDAATSALVSGAAVFIALTGNQVFDPIAAVLGSIILVVVNVYIDIKQSRHIQAHKGPNHTHSEPKAHVH